LWSSGECGCGCSYEVGSD